jgi:RNA polymerase sigma factor (sigma-70 family)
MSDPPTVDMQPAAVLLEQALESTQRSLRHYIQRLVRDVEDTLDIVQEAYVAAVRAAQRREPPFVPGSSAEPIRQWLFHTAYCRAISLLRHRSVVDKNARPVLLDESSTGAHVHTDLFDTQIVEADALRRALQMLEPQDASLLLLRVVHSYTAVELAHSLGMTPAAVRQRLSRSLHKMRAVYLAQNPDGDAAGGRG